MEAVPHSLTERYHEFSNAFMYTRVHLKNSLKKNIAACDNNLLNARVCLHHLILMPQITL